MKKARFSFASFLRFKGKNETTFTGFVFIFLNRKIYLILCSFSVLFILDSFHRLVDFVEDSKDSILAVIAGWIAPIFKPLGFGDWRISTALITGFIAKESVVSTLLVLFGGPEGLFTVLNTQAAISLLVFCLLYTPCVAAVVSIKRESGTKWAVMTVIGQCVIAWICALLARFICLIFV